MILVVGPKVMISKEVVGEETNADLVGEKEPGEGQIFVLGGREDVAHGFEETGCKSLKDGKTDFDGVEICRVFGDWGNGGADEIAEIVKRKSGHDGVEIDDTNPLPGFIAKQDVGDFRIIVDDALRDEPSPVKIDEAVGDGFVLEGKADLVVAAFRAFERIAQDGRFQGSVSFRGMVKIGDGFDEPLSFQTGHEILELSELERGLISQLRRVDDIVAGAAVNELKATPE